MSFNIKDYIVIASNGEINGLDSIQKFAKALERFDKEQRIENEVFLNAINFVFDSNNSSIVGDNTHISKQVLIDLALQELNVQPSNYSILSKRMREFIDYNIGTNKLFGASKGRGIWRWEKNK
jgi:hypothetical protein